MIIHGSESTVYVLKKAEIYLNESPNGISCLVDTDSPLIQENNFVKTYYEDASYALIPLGRIRWIDVTNENFEIRVR